jgi:hypothetical protein
MVSSFLVMAAVALLQLADTAAPASGHSKRDERYSREE